MASKQQQQQVSSGTSQKTSQSFVFYNVDFKGDDENLLRGLRANYSGIENAFRIHQKEGNEKSINAIQIDVKSDKAAQQFLDQTHLNIFVKQYSIQTSPRSLIVLKIGVTEALSQIMQDLTHNYLGIERIHRLYDSEDRPVDCIRIDFKFDTTASKILKDKYIFIGGKRRSVQSYWSCTYVPNENENKPVSQPSVVTKPTKPVNRSARTHLTEKHVRELFDQQQM